jgi:very-short-patch-repair endonuclease
MTNKKTAKSKFGMYYGSNQNIEENAKELRHQETQTEKLLWEKLKGNKINGLKFRRQHPIAQFIADFYCHKAQLVIEIDGGIHLQNDVREYDDNRTFELEKLGLTAIRFSNEDIINRIDMVLEEIEKYVNTEKRPPTP